jgi:hypothetical protein
MSALLWILVLAATCATTVDSARFTPDEYVAAFKHSDLRTYFVGAPFFVLACGAGVLAPPLYFLWARRRLVDVRRGPSDRPARSLAEAERRYRAQITYYPGSPESIADGGSWRLAEGDFGTALYFFQQAIDLLQTLYCVSDMRERAPSERDQSILDAYLAALRRVREQWPQAAVEDTVTNVTHRLRTTTTACREERIDPDRYLRALTDLEQIAPDVDVSNVFWKSPYLV